MNSFIEIVSTEPVKDDEGFVTNGDVIVANIRAHFEQKNSTEKWTNVAQNSNVNALFRFRKIPNINLTDKHVILCNGTRYNIFSTGELVAALSVSDARQDREGNFNVKVGFDEPHSDGKSNAMLAGVLEYGKHGQPPKPFLKPAKQASKSACIAAMKQKFESEVSDV